MIIDLFDKPNEVCWKRPVHIIIVLMAHLYVIMMALDVKYVMILCIDSNSLLCKVLL